MAITNQATLRTAVADWLNRTDLTDAQLDLFIQMAEAKVYEELRVPPLEALEGFSVVLSNSSLPIPSGFLEVIELRHIKTGTCSVSPTTNTTRALCSAASGTWTDADKDDDVSLGRVDGRAFHNSKIANAFTRELTSFLLTDENGEQKASGEYTVKFYKAGDPIGTLVSSVEQVPWILSDQYETVLYSSLAVANTHLGNTEDAALYNTLFMDKVGTLNNKAKQAELKGARFSQVYTEALI